MENTTDRPRALSASDLFASLSEARKAGWQVRCINIGPRDWRHYGVSIRHQEKQVHEVLIPRGWMEEWEIFQAREAALKWINDKDQAQPDNQN